MNTNPEEPSGYADLLGSDSDPTLRRLVDDLDALYSAPVPPAHLTVPPATARPVTTSAAAAPPASWVSLPGGRDAAPHRVPVRRPLAWQPLLRVAALAVLLLGGLLIGVLGVGGPDGPRGLQGLVATTRTPPPDRFAQSALQWVQRDPRTNTPPVVVLNRRLRAADLPCLGLGSLPGLPADEPVRLVIVHGDDLDAGVLGSQTARQMLHYVGYVFVERDGAMTLAFGSLNGGLFRLALNDPTLLDDDIGISHNLAGWAQRDPVAGPVLTGHLGQALHETQTQGAWMITLERVYADTNRVALLYTVRGPTARAAVATPVLALSTGEEIPLLGRGVDGPTPDGAESLWRGLVLLDAHDLSPAAQWTLRVTMPAIHDIPATPTPPLPACGPALPDPGTPLPTWTPGPPALPAAPATAAEVAPPGPSVTPVPVGTAPPSTVLAGPFTFTLTVPVIPSTPLPQPQPTTSVGLLQAVPSTGPTTPQPSPR